MQPTPTAALQPLADLLPALRAHEARVTSAPSRLAHLRHRRLLEAALDGRIAGAERIAGRWYFQPALVPMIAAELGVAPPEGPGREHRAGSAELAAVLA